MSKKIVIRGGQKILGSLDSGLGDPILTKDETSKEIGQIPAIDSSTFLSTSLTSGYLIVGNSSNIATPRQITGAISFNDLGVTSISADYITNTHVNSAAGILYSKLNLTASIINSDIAAAANITRTKIANGNINRVLVNNGSGVFSENTALTPNRALVSDINGLPIHSTVTTTVLQFLDATSSVQTQLNNKLSFSSAIVPAVGDLISYTAGVWTRLGVGSDGEVLTVVAGAPVWASGTSNGLPSGGSAGQYLNKIDGTDYNTQWSTLLLAAVTDVTATAAEVNILDGATLTVTELNYVDGVTSSIQTQLNSKLDNSLAHNAIWVGNVSNQANQLSAGTNGYVLTIVAGSPQWQPASSADGHIIQSDGVTLSTEPLLNFTNGISGIDDPGTFASIIKLGGTLIEDTDISGAFTLSLGDSTALTNFSVVADTDVSLYAFGEVRLEGDVFNVITNSEGFIGYSSTIEHIISFGSSGIVVNLDPTGSPTFQAGADHSANFNSLSYITKGYADATYGGGGSFWDLGSGGALTGTNTISGAFDVNFTNTAVKFSATTFRVRNPADTFEYAINGTAIAGDRNISLPLLGSGSNFRLMVVNSAATTGAIPFETAGVAGGYTISSNITYVTGTSTFSTVNTALTGVLTINSSISGEYLAVSAQNSSAGATATTVIQLSNGTNTGRITLLGTGTSIANSLTISTNNGQIGIIPLSSGLVISRGSVTITSSTMVDIRGIGTTTGLGLRVADSANTLRFSIADNGKAIIGAADATSTQLIVTNAASHTNIVSFNNNSGNARWTLSNTGTLTHTVLGGVSITISSGIAAITNSITTSGASSNTLLTNTLGLTDSSATGQTQRNLLLNGTINTTGTFTGTYYGIDYDPTLTSVVGLTHIALRTTSGSIFIANSSADTLTATTRLDVRGIASGTIARFSSDTNGNVFQILNTGSTIYGSAASSPAISAQNNGSNVIGGHGLEILPSLTSSNSIGLDFRTRSTTVSETSGTFRYARFIGASFAPASGTATYNLINLVGSINSASTGLVRSISIETVYTAHLGDVIGIDYAPAVTSITGTHLALRATSGNVLIGGTTITASTRVDIRGQGTTTNRALRIADSGNTERFYILDNGTAALTTTSSGIAFTSTNNDNSNSVLNFNASNINTGSGAVAGYLMTTDAGSSSMSLSSIANGSIMGFFGSQTGGFRFWNSHTSTSNSFRIYTSNDLAVIAYNVSALSNHTWRQRVHTTGSPTAFTFTPAAHTTLTASVESTDINFNLARTVQFGTGALATQRAFRIQAPTYAFVASSTITKAVTLSISGAPVAGTNAILTATYALDIEAGSIRLGAILNDDALTEVLVRNSSTGEIKYRTAASLGGGGGVSASGTPVDNQLAVWTNATTIEGTSALTYDGTTFTVNGGTIVGSATTQNIFNTTATTINFAGAATTFSMGHVATAAQTVNMFTASTGASIYNFATGPTSNGTTKSINIGGEGVAGSTTNVFIGSSIASALGTLTLSFPTVLSNPNNNIVALWNINATTINFGGEATTFNLGGNTTSGVVANFFANATTTSKTISIGTGGAGGSTTNIHLGSTTASTSGTLNLNFPTVLAASNNLTISLWNTLSTTISFAGATTTFNLGGTPTGAITANFFTNATLTATTKTLNIGTAGVSGSVTNVNISSSVSGATGTTTIGGSTLVLFNTPATDAGFSTSTMLVRDSSGNVDVIAASGGGTTTFLRADGTWATPSGSGSSVGSNNEVQTSDGAGGFVASKLFFDETTGNMILGDSGLAGDRTIQASSSSGTSAIVLIAKGSLGQVQFKNDTNTPYVTVYGNAATNAIQQSSAGGLTFQIIASGGGIGSDNGSHLILTSGAGSTNGNGGNTYIHYAPKAGSGTDGNIGLLTNSSTVNFQSMERGIFIGDAAVAPTGNPTNGNFFWIDAATSVPYWRAEDGTIRRAYSEAEIIALIELYGMTGGQAEALNNAPN